MEFFDKNAVIDIDYFKSKGIDIRITHCSDLDEKFRVIRN